MDGKTGELGARAPNFYMTHNVPSDFYTINNASIISAIASVSN